MSQPTPGGEADRVSAPVPKPPQPQAASSESAGFSQMANSATAAVVKKPKRRVSGGKPAKPVELKVPPILLEGDAPVGPQMSGPGLRYALAPQPVARAEKTPIGELPVAYGTGRLFLAARDPRWLYASWDFTPEQQNELNARSRDGHLIVRVLAEGQKNTAVPEVHVHPESRHWFINVPKGETRYKAEIGFYERGGTWRSVAVSPGTFAPPDAASEDTSVEFATIPPQVTFKQVLELVEQFVTGKEGQPLLEVVAEAQKQLAAEPKKPDEAASRTSQKAGEPVERAGEVRTSRVQPRDLPQPVRAPEAWRLPVEIKPGQPWNRERRAALKRLIHMDERRRVFIGSIEITELVRRELAEEELASIAAQEGRGVPTGFPIEEVAPFAAGISSPSGGEVPKGRGRKFWFKVNAELIVYGATEPDAKVTVADRQIKLRPDGTFSFRFSLPDGRYQLPAMAVSGDGEEEREARLEFARSTEYRGRVEAHPQDQALRPPHGENIQ